MKMTKVQIVYSMCETWINGFSELGDKEKEFIYNKMFQVFTNDIQPHMEFREPNNGYVTVGKLLGILDEYDKRFYELEYELEMLKKTNKTTSNVSVGMTSYGYPWKIVGSDGC